jgi:hypothetical protein
VQYLTSGLATSTYMWGSSDGTSCESETSRSCASLRPRHTVHPEHNYPPQRPPLINWGSIVSSPICSGPIYLGATQSEYELFRRIFEKVSWQELRVLEVTKRALQRTNESLEGLITLSGI